MDLFSFFSPGMFSKVCFIYLTTSFLTYKNEEIISILYDFIIWKLLLMQRWFVPPNRNSDTLFSRVMCSSAIGGGLGLMAMGYVVEMSGTWSILCKLSSICDLLSIFILALPAVWRNLEALKIKG
jgi:hypothetical protein